MNTVIFPDGSSLDLPSPPPPVFARSRSPKIGRDRRRGASDLNWLAGELRRAITRLESRLENRLTEFEAKHLGMSSRLDVLEAGSGDEEMEPKTPVKKREEEGIF